MSLSLDEARLGLRSDEEESVAARSRAWRRRAGAVEMADTLDFLVEAMGDPSWRVRKEAAARAAAFGDPKLAAEVLAAALAEPENVGRRNAVVEALVGLGAAGGAGVDRGAPREAGASQAHCRRARAHRRSARGRGAGADRRRRGRERAHRPSPRRWDASAARRRAEALERALARGELLLSQAALEGLNRLGAALRSASSSAVDHADAARGCARGARPHRRAAGARRHRRGARRFDALDARRGDSRARRSYRRLDPIGREAVAAEVASHRDALPALTTALLEATLGTQRTRRCCSASSSGPRRRGRWCWRSAIAICARRRCRR